MALPASGAISFSAINTELGRTSTDPLRWNDWDLRATAGVPTTNTSALGLNTLYNKVRGGFWFNNGDTLSTTRSVSNTFAYASGAPFAIDTTGGIGGGSATKNSGPSTWFVSPANTDMRNYYQVRLVTGAWSVTAGTWTFQVNGGTYSNPTGGFDTGYNSYDATFGWSFSMIVNSVPAATTAVASFSGTIYIKRISDAQVISCPITTSFTKIRT